jgi:hypothetical protein
VFLSSRDRFQFLKQNEFITRGIYFSFGDFEKKEIRTGVLIFCRETKNGEKCLIQNHVLILILAKQNMLPLSHHTVDFFSGTLVLTHVSL